MRRCWKAFIFLAFAGLIYLIAIVLAGLSAQPQPSDIAVVLGNEVLRDGTPSLRLKARLDCAADLYRRRLTKRILVSGGIGKSRFDEATVMAKYLVSQGVATGDILIDSEGFNTRATAINTATLSHSEHFNRIIIVSQFYHIPRCTLAFRKVGLAAISADYPRYFEWGDLIAILREGIALPVYFIKMSGKE